MSGTVDVGDAVELTFTTAAGATVTVTWIDPDGATVLDHLPVTEAPTGSGAFPYTLEATQPGTWTAIFTSSGTATAVERYYIRASAVTGPAPLAVVADVAAQYGDLTPAQETLTGWLLRAASAIVRSQFPKVDDHIRGGLLDPEVVALAVTAMVLRVLRNPEGLRAQTTGPFSRSFDTSAAVGLLVITANETTMLTPLPASVLGPAAAGVGTIMVRPGLAAPPYGNYSQLRVPYGPLDRRSADGW